MFDFFHITVNKNKICFFFKSQKCLGILKGYQKEIIAVDYPFCLLNLGTYKTTSVFYFSVIGKKSFKYFRNCTVQELKEF